MCTPPSTGRRTCRPAHDQSSRHLMKSPDGRAVGADPYGPSPCVSRVPSSGQPRSVGISTESVRTSADRARRVRAHRETRTSMRVLGAMPPGVTSAAVNAPDPAPAPADPTVAGPEATEPADDDTDDASSSGRVAHDRDRPTARVDREIPDAPDPRTRYRRALHVGTALRSLWSSRHIMWSLAWRDLRASYSQEILGFSWALIGPIMLMVVLTFLKGVSNTTINTHGVAYPLFLYV